MAQPTSTPSALGVRSRTGFLNLPAELRNQIYFLALTTDEHIYIKHRNNPRNTAYAENHDLKPVHLPVPLLRTCKEIHAEATPILYGSNKFRMYDFQGRLCLSRLGTNLQYIRHLGLLTINPSTYRCLDAFKSLTSAARLVELALEGCTSPSCPLRDVIAAFMPIALSLIKAGQSPAQVANVLLFCVRDRETEKGREEQKWAPTIDGSRFARALKLVLERELGLQEEDEDSCRFYESYDAENLFLDWLGEFTAMQKQMWNGTQLY